MMIYFSGLLPARYPLVFKDLTASLDGHGVPWGLLAHTRDIWCQDYMPVQVGPEDFVQFKYAPSYLNSKKWRLTITDAAPVCAALGVQPSSSDIVVDGGNVVRLGQTALMTKRVYQENPSYSKRDLFALLQRVLKVERLILIPVEPGDPFGHADGCIRLISDTKVAISTPQKGQQKFARALGAILKESGLLPVELPCWIENDPAFPYSAVGNYVNYLVAGDLVVVPSYRGHEEENERALSILQKAGGHHRTVVPVEATALAKEGGIINCVSWVKY